MQAEYSDLYYNHLNCWNPRDHTGANYIAPPHHIELIQSKSLLLYKD